jgi:hypothetical protein
MPYEMISIEFYLDVIEYSQKRVQYIEMEVSATRKELHWLLPNLGFFAPRRFAVRTLICSQIPHQ